jgi:hypothetical protein
MKVKIHIRGLVEVDLPDSVCLDCRKSGKWRLSYSDDEVRSINSAVRKHLREAAAEPDRVRAGLPDLHYHSMFAGREYPPMPKEVP